jgi:hypothetical protein
LSGLGCRRSSSSLEAHGRTGTSKSFNGKFRDELLDREIFYTVAEAKVLVERWRREYNTIRPHSALGYRPPGIVSVDPIDAAPLLANLRREGVIDLVEFHGTYPHEFWPNWHDDIRLLWHDGANDRSTVHADVMAAPPFLVDRSIVAFHDVRNASGEGVHVFIDDILGSPHFGTSGVCRCIGWSQYRSDPADTRAFQPQKAVLRRKLERLRPYHDLSRGQPHGLRKHQYKVLRWFVPHGDVVPDRWMRGVSATPAS